MKISHLDTSEKVLIVAEVGNNHEGDYALAQDLIRLAADAGADAVKFQTFRPEHYVSSSNPERLARLQQFALSFDQFAALAELAEQNGLVFLSTPFDLESARLVARIAPAVKVSSSDNTFYPLLEAISETGKPVLLSTGLIDLPSLRQTVHLVTRIWDDAGVCPGLALLHCVSAYPVPPEEACLANITALAAEFPQATVGYSDHTLGMEAAVLAVAAGARVIEKHFTIDKRYSDFRDHELSADPEDMRELVRRVREAEALLGDGDLRVRACEQGNAAAMRRSIVATHNLEVGHVVCADDITWTRPAGGLPPGSEAKLMGKVVRRRVAAWQPIALEAVGGGE